MTSPSQPERRRSTFLEEAHRVLKSAEKEADRIHPAADQVAALEKIARAYGDLAAIELGRPPNDASADRGAPTVR